MCDQGVEAADLGVGIYNTEDGVYPFRLSMKSLKMSLFCRLRFARDQRLHYPFAVGSIFCVAHPLDPVTKSATHAVDFSPSATSLLTAKSMDRWGVIVVGDRVKGKTELYSSEKVKYEEWWTKKYPRFGKTT
jgi:hypothetical protein